MLHKICIAFIALYVGCSLPALKAQNETSQKTPNQLKVLTWNVYMLPIFINNSKRVQRAKGIVETLQNADYDVVLLQETFHKKSVRIIEEGLKKTFPHHIKANRKGGFLKFHHGIFILSKLPAKVLDAITFKECSGFDCFSKKGALLIEVEKEAQQFQILGTHLQASNEDKHEAIRKTQRQQITSLLNKHKKNNVPQLLCGDFNTNYKHLSRRKKMLNDLEITAPIVAEDKTWPHQFYETKKTHTAILDYIFIKSNNFELSVANTKVQHFQDARSKMALSDHAAVEMLLSW